MIFVQNAAKAGGFIVKFYNKNTQQYRKLRKKNA